MKENFESNPFEGNEEIPEEEKPTDESPENVNIELPGPSAEELAEMNAKYKEKDEQRIRELRQQLGLSPEVPAEEIEIEEKRNSLIGGIRTKGLEDPQVLEAYRGWIQEKEAGAGESLRDRISVIQDQAAILEDAGRLQDAFEELLYARQLAEQEGDEQAFKYVEAELDKLDAGMEGEQS
jgi:hypothetical protein